MLDGALDAIDGPFGKFEHERRVFARREFRNRIERRVHASSPAASLVIIDKFTRAGGAVDRIAKPLRNCLVIGTIDGRHSQIKRPEQGRIALREMHDHLHERIQALLHQMAAYPCERAGARRFRIGCCVLDRHRLGPLTPTRSCRGVWR